MAVWSLAVPPTLCAALLAGCAPAGRRASAPLPPSTRPTASLTKPVLQPLTQPAYSLSNVVEQTLPGHPYFAHVAVNTTVRTLARSIDAAIGELVKHPEINSEAVGPPVFIYRGMTANLDQPFDVDVGFPVGAAFRPSGGVKVRAVRPLRCVTTEFAGPVSAIDKAYDRLLPAVSSLGFRPTGETRELHLRWDERGANPDDNQILVAVGVR